MEYRVPSVIDSMPPGAARCAAIRALVEDDRIHRDPYLSEEVCA